MRNDFASLDAQTAEGALATVAAHELPAHNTPRLCYVDCVDIGDEDCRKLAFDVVDCETNQTLVSANRREIALAWIADNNFTLTPNP